MKSQQYPTTNAPARSDDTYDMKEAIGALLDEGVRFDRLTKYQLKIDRFSFYPGRNTITEDDNPELRAKGLDTFIDLIKREFPLRRRSTTSAPDSITMEITATTEPTTPAWRRQGRR